MTLRGLTQPKWFWMPPEALWVTAVRAEVLPQPLHKTCVVMCEQGRGTQWQPQHPSAQPQVSPELCTGAERHKREPWSPPRDFPAGEATAERFPRLTWVSS